MKTLQELEQMLEADLVEYAHSIGLEDVSVNDLKAETINKVLEFQQDVTDGLGVDAETHESIGNEAPLDPSTFGDHVIDNVSNTEPPKETTAPLTFVEMSDCKHCGCSSVSDNMSCPNCQHNKE